jgi:hypothetical protein
MIGISLSSKNQEARHQKTNGGYSKLFMDFALLSKENPPGTSDCSGSLTQEE